MGFSEQWMPSRNEAAENDKIILPPVMDLISRRLFVDAKNSAL
jgi:hypothetical protein